MDSVYEVVYRGLLRHLPAETAHRAGFWLIRTAGALPAVNWLLRRWLAPRDPVLRVQALGLDLPGPLGLAAGFDKDARGVDALAALGFAFIEVGTVTAQAQPGNARPRMFRLPADRALVNRMGFNNAGAAAAAERLRARELRAAARPGRRARQGADRSRGGARGGGARGSGRRARDRVVVGVNIGKTKAVPAAEAIADYVTSARLVAGMADYVVVNVSSPNTPGLRDLQAVSSLRPLLTAVRAALDGQRRSRRGDRGPEAANGGETAAARRRVPLLVKIAPDLADADVDAIADLAVELGLDGIIATNTTIARPDLVSDPALVAGVGAGGLSGAPLRPRALEVLRRLHARAGRPACPHRGRGDRDRRRRLGAHRRRRHPGAGLHRFHLRRAALAAPDPGRAGPPGAGCGAEVGQCGPRDNGCAAPAISGRRWGAPLTSSLP